MGFIEPFCIIEKELSEVRRCIDAQLFSCNDEVNKLLRYISGRFGKMIRPGLVFLSGKCCGGIDKRHIEVGAVVEMIHTATLLHDDVIDNAQSRRNADTANKLWGNVSAVLLGDFLLTRVLVMCIGFKSKKDGSFLAEVAQRVCQGELVQNLERNNWNLNQEAYLDIIRDKTAAFFGCCCRLGAMVSDGEDVKVNALNEYGLNLGIAFQITDDIIDLTGNELQAGKTLGTDAGNCKLTLPLIHFLESTGQANGDAAVKQIINMDGQTLAGKLEDSGSLEYSRQLARQYCNKAKESLESIVDCQARDALLEIAESMTTRVG